MPAACLALNVDQFDDDSSLDCVALAVGIAATAAAAAPAASNGFAAESVPLPSMTSVDNPPAMSDENALKLVQFAALIAPVCVADAESMPICPPV